MSVTTDEECLLISKSNVEQQCLLLRTRLSYALRGTFFVFKQREAEASALAARQTLVARRATKRKALEDLKVAIQEEMRNELSRYSHFHNVCCIEHRCVRFLCHMFCPIFITHDMQLPARSR